MKTAFALALAAAAVAPADAGICCQTTLLLGAEISVWGYDCTTGA